MKRLIILFILLTFTCSFAATSPDKNQFQFSLKPSKQLTATKSMTGAAILETAVPTLGFLYAGDWAKGLLPNLTSLSGATLMLTQANLYGPNKKLVAKSTFLFYGGLLLYIGGKIWAYSALAETVSKYNESLQIGLNTSANHQALCLTIRYAF